MSVDRRQARVLAMQTLCHHDVQPGGGLGVLEAVASNSEAKSGTIRYATDICSHYFKSSRFTNKQISEALTEWTLERLNPVDRNVLRVATIELEQRKIPVNVVFDEAIEIAREYGSPESARFVHGVLDAIRESLLE